MYSYMRPSKLINVHSNPGNPGTVRCNNCGYAFDALDSAIWTCPGCGKPVRKDALQEE